MIENKMQGYKNRLKKLGQKAKLNLGQIMEVIKFIEQELNLRKK